MIAADERAEKQHRKSQTNELKSQHRPVSNLPLLLVGRRFNRFGSTPGKSTLP
jgi:hypothetical protein